MGLLHATIAFAWLFAGDIRIAADNPSTDRTPGQKEQALERLRTSLETLDYPGSLSAVAELRQLGQVDAMARVLSESLKRSDPRARWQAARAAGRMGPGARGVVPELSKVLKDNDALARWAAAESLAALGPDARSAIPALIDGLGASDPITRRTCAEALLKVGPDAGAAVPGLIEALRDADPAVQKRAADALRHFFRSQVSSMIEFAEAEPGEKQG